MPGGTVWGWLRRRATRCASNGARRSATHGTGHSRSDWARALHATLRAKEGVAEPAETFVLHLTRVRGGGTHSRRSPFARWFEDVRALGSSHPHWGLAYDALFGATFI